MHAGPSGAAFEAVARDPAINADGISDRLSTVARLRYGLKRLYAPIMDGLPARFSYLLMLLDRSQKIESNYLLSRHSSGLEMEIVEHCCFVQPAR
jgi:hypothetical protein